MADKDNFHMVYGEGMGSPTFKHDSFDGAASEAKRLAGLHPGVTFHVLMQVARARRHDPIELVQTFHSDDGVPF